MTKNNILTIDKKRFARLTSVCQIMTSQTKLRDTFRMPRLLLCLPEKGKMKLK